MVTDADERRLTSLLLRDVASTIGDIADLADAIRMSARKHRSWETDPDRYTERVVDDVQQYVHDCFIDTAWPRCPTHPNHPMWFRHGWWCADDEPFARLGELQPGR